MLRGLHFSVKCSQEAPHVVTCCAVTGTLEAAWLQSGKCLRYPGALWDPRRLGPRLRCLVTPRKSAGETPLTLCDPMDCSLPGSSVHGIFQARILEWIAISFSRGSSSPRDGTHIPYTGRRSLYGCTTWEALGWFLVVSYYK